MSTHSTAIINKISQKLGINNPDVLLKTSEHLRNVNSKSNISVNEMLKAIICLEIACSQLGQKFDKTYALKLAVVTKAQYQKHFLLIKNLMQVENTKSVHEICIQLSCEEASKYAEILLEKYKENDCISRDFNHPQYAVAAVYTICKLQKTSIKKSDFISLSTLKPQQWTMLESEFNKFVKEHNFTVDIARRMGKKTGNEFLSLVEQKSKEIEKVNELQKRKQAEEAAENYEDWKKRILEEAYAHCNKV